MLGCPGGVTIWGISANILLSARAERIALLVWNQGVHPGMRGTKVLTLIQGDTGSPRWSIPAKSEMAGLEAGRSRQSSAKTCSQFKSRLYTGGDCDAIER
jgi:hypothetical protein